ncbi:MAG TPA: hypothetical protein VFQ16_09495, partial [Burkholderiaceae bacterium]|nr:hypothetical protein [Burkholderiaceae bacterium]
LIEARSALVLNEVFPKMAAAGITIRQQVPSDRIERVLGIDVTHKLKELTANLYRNVDEDLESLKAAHDKLRATMKALYPGKKFLQVVFEDSEVAA